MREQPFVAKFAVLTGGFWVWAFHLAAVYTFTSLACTPALQPRFGHTGEAIGIAAATGVSLLADLLLIAMAIAGRGPGLSGDHGSVQSMWRYMAGAAAMLSAMAVIWQALPALMVSAC